MSDWLTSEAMVDLYGMSQASLEQFAYQNRGSCFVKKEGRNNYYNITELKRVRDRRVDIRNEAHDMYYELIDTMHHELQIDKLVRVTEHKNRGTWGMFLTYSMWSAIDHKSVLAVNCESKLLFCYHEWAKKELYGPKDHFELLAMEESYPEVDISGYDSVDHYYDYHEALKLKTPFST